MTMLQSNKMMALALIYLAVAVASCQALSTAGAASTSGSSDVNVHVDAAVPHRIYHKQGSIMATLYNEFLDVPEDGADDDGDYLEFGFDNESSKFQSRRRKMQSSTSESTRVNIFQKLGESLGTTIVGFILICCMPFLIWKNEGRHVKELQRIDFCKDSTDVDPNSPGDNTTGQLVHFVGIVSVDDSFLDFDNQNQKLNLLEPVPNAIVLKRTCYIYQKFEQVSKQTDKDFVGGGETRTTTYTCREDWVTSPKEPTLPHLPQETNSRGIWDGLVSAAGAPKGGPSGGAAGIPQLPPGMAEQLGLVDPSQPPNGIVVNPATHVGAFGLSSAVVMEHPMVFSDNFLPVPNNLLPPSIEGCDGLIKGSDNVLRTFPEGQPPRNGDCKVVYEFAKDGFDCTFVAQQITHSGEGNAKYGVDKAPVVNNKICADKDLGDIWMVRKGQHSLEDMLGMAKDDEKKILMLLRVVGCALLCAGWIMLFDPFVTALQVLPVLSQLGYFAVVLTAMIVSCLCCLTITSVAYMRYRPLLTSGLLVVALGIWGIVAWRLNEAAEKGGDTSS